MIDISGIREFFPVKQSLLYFNFAADGPLPVPSQNALCEAAKECSRIGSIPVDKQSGVFEGMRSELSTLFKGKKENFAYITNTSEGILYSLLAVDIKEDENYIIAADSFPTTYRLMENMCKGTRKNVYINDATPLVDQVKKQVDSKTRAIILDWVHYFSGKVIDLTPIVELARSKNIFTIIDGIQGAGSLSIELERSGVDFFFTGGQKWLLSPQGSGFIYVSDKVWEKIPRKSFGWLGYDWKDFSDYSIDPEMRPGAGVMEYGTRPFITGTAFRESLRLFNRFDLKAIESHTMELRKFFVEQIVKRGYETILNESMAPIVPFKKPGKESAELLRELNKKNVSLALRNGYLRAAFHFINEREEVERLIELLP